MSTNELLPIRDGSPMYDRLILRNDGDQPTGLWIPHWFMNGSDYHAFFRPGEGAQAPFLFTAISTARATAQIKTSQLHIFSTIEDTVNQIDGFLKNPPTGNAAYYARQNLRSRYLKPLLTLLENKKSVFVEAKRDDSWSSYQGAVEAMRATVQGEGPIDPLSNDTIREELRKIQAHLVNDRSYMLSDTAVPVGVDSPVHFDFDEFVTTTFMEVLSREADRNPNLRTLCRYLAATP